MTKIHEIDAIGHRYDRQTSVSDERHGKGAAIRFMLELTDRGVQIPPDARLLGLGSGTGRPERGFAKELVLPDRQITLVDKNASLVNADEISSHPEISFINSGIFHFLEQPNQTGFFVVTLFGLEYLLNSNRVQDSLFRLLPNVLADLSFVFISPLALNQEIERDIQKSKFKVIFSDKTNSPFLAEYKV